MRNLSAYLMIVLGGNQKPSVEDVKTLLQSVGADAEEDRIEKMVTELEGKNVEEIIKEGLQKLISIPTGGAATHDATTGSIIATATAEEKKEEEEEEEEVDMSGGGLFGGDEEEDW